MFCIPASDMGGCLLWFSCARQYVMFGCLLSISFGFAEVLYMYASITYIILIKTTENKLNHINIT